MSFFAPNWAVALSLLFPADRGGRPSPVQISRSREVGITSGAARPPSSATLASIPAWASSVSKKDIHIPGNNVIAEFPAAQSGHSPQVQVSCAAPTEGVFYVSSCLEGARSIGVGVP